MHRLGLYLLVWGMLILQGSDVFAEAVKDVRFRTEGNQVEVFYTLVGEGEYEVSLQLSNDGGRTFLLVPHSLSGDVGSAVEPGRNKRIIWDVLKDVPRLEGDAFVFKVTASQPGNRLDKKWLLGLAAVGGGATVYALLRGEEVLLSPDEENTIIIEIPDPEEAR